MFCDRYNYMETRLKTCLYSFNNVCTATIFQRLNWIIPWGHHKHKKTYLQVSICTYSYRFVLFCMLNTDVNVKNKCTCTDVERFKDMFANSKRLLAVAATACRPGFYSQPSICLLFLSFLICYADSCKTKILISKCMSMAWFTFALRTSIFSLVSC